MAPAGKWLKKRRGSANACASSLVCQWKWSTSGLTSWEAERLLEEQQGRTIHAAVEQKTEERNAKTGVDALAAALILKEYLDRGHAGAGDEVRRESEELREADREVDLRRVLIVVVLVLLGAGRQRAPGCGTPSRIRTRDSARKACS